MGELFKQGILTEDNMHECIRKLVKEHDEGSLEQLCKLLSSVGQDLDAEKAKVSPESVQGKCGLNLTMYF